MLHPVVIQKETDAETQDQRDCTEDGGSTMDSNNVKLVAVLEFIRVINKDGDNKGPGAFNEEDEEIADSYSAWGEVALHYSDLYHRIGRQKNLSAFLLDVVKYVLYVIYPIK